MTITGVNVKWNCPVFRYNVERFWAWNQYTMEYGIANTYPVRQTEEPRRSIISVRSSERSYGFNLPVWHTRSNSNGPTRAAQRPLFPDQSGEMLGG